MAFGQGCRLSYRFSSKMKREKLDPYWHKSRVAARILLKARQGRPLNARDKRLAAAFASDHGVENRLIQQGINYWVAPYTTGRDFKRKERVCNVTLYTD